MTNDKPKEKLKLASIKDVSEKTYTTKAKDYFEPKAGGISQSKVRKLFFAIAGGLGLSIMLPQLFSERRRQEVALEIRMQEHPQEDFKIPPMQNEGRARYQNGIESDGTKRKSKLIEKIKSIDLRVQAAPPAGAEAQAVLISGGANGLVKARLIENLMVGSDLYAVKDSVLIGKGSSSDKRLYITFDKIISPEGKFKKTFGEAYDNGDKIRGIIGQQVSDHIFKIAASSALIFLSGVAESLQDQSDNPFGSRRKSLHDAALSGVAQASSEHGKKYLDSLNQASQVEVKQQTPFVVIFAPEGGANE